MYYTVEVQEIKDYFTSMGRVLENTTGDSINDFVVIPDYVYNDLKRKSEIIINDWITRSGFANTKCCGYQYTQDELKTIITEAICMLCYDFQYTCVASENESAEAKEQKQIKKTYLYLRDKGVL